MDLQSGSVIDAMVFREQNESMTCSDAKDSVLGMPKPHADGHRQFEEIEWRVEGGPRATSSVLIGRTCQGLTVVTDHQSACSEGNVLIPSRRSQWRGWRRPVQIKRVVQLSDAIDLIAADYISRPPEPSTSDAGILPLIP